MDFASRDRRKSVRIGGAPNDREELVLSGFAIQSKCSTSGSWDPKGSDKKISNIDLEFFRGSDNEKPLYTRTFERSNWIALKKATVFAIGFSSRLKVSQWRVNRLFGSR